MSEKLTADSPRYRIVEMGDGKFRLQDLVSAYWGDRIGHFYYYSNINDFSTLPEARKYRDRLIQEAHDRELANTIKRVVE